MPNENVEITATYEDVRYSLTVDRGLGSGDFAEGEVVQITADIEPNLNKYEFNWKVSEGDREEKIIENPEQLTTTVQMPAHDLTVSYDLSMYLTSENGYSVYIPAPSGWEYHKGYKDDLSVGMVNIKTDEKNDMIKATYCIESYDSATQTVDVDGCTDLNLDNGKKVYYKEKEGELLGIYIPCEGEVLSVRTDSSLEKITEKFGTEENLVRTLFEEVKEKA